MSYAHYAQAEPAPPQGREAVARSLENGTAPAAPAPPGGDEPTGAEGEASPPGAAPVSDPPPVPATAPPAPEPGAVELGANPEQQAATAKLLSELDARYSRRHSYHRQGIYARMSGGFGGLTDTVISNQNAKNNRKAEGRITGIGTASSLAVGGGLSPRFVLGGAFHSTQVLAYTVLVREGYTVPEEITRVDSLTILGPFFDLFFGKDSGWHLQGSLGLAALSKLNPRLVNTDTPALGAGLTFGVGYDWAVSERWTFGVLGQAASAVLAEESDSGRGFLHLAAASPSLLLSATTF